LCCGQPGIGGGEHHHANKGVDQVPEAALRIG